MLQIPVTRASTESGPVARPYQLWGVRACGDAGRPRVVGKTRTLSGQEPSDRCMGLSRPIPADPPLRLFLVSSQVCLQPHDTFPISQPCHIPFLGAFLHACPSVRSHINSTFCLEGHTQCSWPESSPSSVMLLGLLPRMLLGLPPPVSRPRWEVRACHFLP